MTQPTQTDPPLTLPGIGAENALTAWLTDHGSEPYQLRKAQWKGARVSYEVYGQDGGRKRWADGEALTLSCEIGPVASAEAARHELGLHLLEKLCDALELLSLLRDIEEHGITDDPNIDEPISTDDPSIEESISMEEGVTIEEESPHTPRTLGAIFQAKPNTILVSVAHGEERTPVLRMARQGSALFLVDRFGDSWPVGEEASPMETAFGYTFWNAKFRDWLRAEGFMSDDGSVIKEGAEVVMRW